VTAPGRSDAATDAAQCARELAVLCDGSVTAGFAEPIVDVAADRWVQSLTLARDRLGLGYFDWLSAVDELDQGFSVLCHLARVDLVGPGPQARPLVHLLVRTAVPRDAAALASATAVFSGANWHERETWEMFGIDFPGHPALLPLLLPDGFAGRPLRKDFELSARLARPWPGAKDPARAKGAR